MSDNSEEEIQLGKYIIPEKTLNKMIKTILLSRQTGIEYGYTMCVKDNIICLHNYCEGTKCEVELKESCPRDEKFIGYFHVHSSGEDYPSLSDLIITYLTGYLCIGFARSGIILFYIKKNSDKRVLDYMITADKYYHEQLSHIQSNPELYSSDDMDKLIESYRNDVNMVINKLFEVIKLSQIKIKSNKILILEQIE